MHAAGAGGGECVAGSGRGPYGTWANVYEVRGKGLGCHAPATHLLHTCFTPAPHLPHTRRCHELLRLLLELLQHSSRHAAPASSPAVRTQLYGCLLHYLQYCRGSRLGTSSTPAVLEAVLQGWAAGPALTGESVQGAASRLDATQVSRSLLY